MRLRPDLPDAATRLLEAITFGDVVGPHPGHWAFVVDGTVVDSDLSGSEAAVHGGGGLVVVARTGVSGSTVFVGDAAGAGLAPVYARDDGTVPLVAFPIPAGGHVIVAGSTAVEHAGVLVVALADLAVDVVVPSRSSGRGFLAEAHWSATGRTVAVPDCDLRTCTTDVVDLVNRRGVTVDGLVPLAVTDAWLLGYRSTDDFAWEQVDIATGARTSIESLATVAPWSAYALPSGRILVSGRSEADVLAVLVLDPATGAVQPIYTAPDDLRYPHPLVIDEDWAVLGPRAPLAGVIAGLETLHVLELGSGRLYEDALRVD